jgi:hypothetical protein
MASLLKYQKHLLLLGLLMVAKFIWVPLWESKQEHWQLLSQGQHNLAKMKALITISQPMSQRQDEINQQLQQSELLMPSTTDLTTYKLTAQAAIENLFSRYQLSLDRTAWRNGVNERDIHVLLLDLRFNGKLKHYLRLLEELDTSKDFINLIIVRDELNIRSQSQTSLGTVDGQVTLQLAVKIDQTTRLAQ